MLVFRKPSPAKIRDFLESQARLELTYTAVGATAAVPPPGYVVDHTRIRLGEGAAVFETAKSALVRWEQFRLGWVEAWPSDTPIRTGEVVAVIARAFGMWWLNACRIVYVVDDWEPVRRFGFGYGTLPGHLGTGEERFLIEWDRTNDAVWYDILAFSRPQQLLPRLGYPMMRRTQRRFGRGSAAVMLGVVRSAMASRTHPA